MPHASLKVIPGVDQNKTPALNEAAISQSQLIRFIPDRAGIGLPQKLGGWVKYYQGKFSSAIRSLWAWADINSNDYLAVGAETSLNTIQPNALLTSQAITNVSAANGVVTLTFAGPYTFQVGTSIVVAGLTPTGYNGTYAVSASSSTTVSYLNVNTGAATIGSATVSAYGNELNVITPRTFTNSSAVHFETTAGNSTVTVTDYNGNSVNSYTSVYIKTPVSVGGLVLYGTYQCTANTTNTYFITARDTLGAPSPAVWSTTLPITKISGSGSIVTVTFGAEVAAEVASSSISGTTLTVGTLTSGTIAVGQIVYGANVLAGTKIVANISGTGAGSTWTVDTSQTAASSTMYMATEIPDSVSVPFISGSTIVISGMTPSGYNGTFTVISSTSSTVTYANTTTASPTVFGTISGYGSVPKFATTAGSSIVTVTVDSNDYTVGREFPVLVPVTVGGVTIPVGNYYAISVFNDNTFTIQIDFTATSTASVLMNSGNALFEYFVGLGPVPAGSGYGQGNYGSGNYGAPLNQYLATGASGSGTVATVTFSGGVTIPVGSTVSVAGIIDSVTLAAEVATSSISGTVLTIGTVTTGTIAVGQEVYGPNVAPGTTITGNLSGSGAGSTWTVSVSQTAASSTMYMTAANAVSGYSGIYTVTSPSSAGSITYANATTATWVYGGSVTSITSQSNTGSPITTTDWTLDNYGSLLVAVPVGGPIYIYDPASGSSIATIIPTGPAANAGAFVAMPERQIVAWGSTFDGIQDPLLIRYSHVNDLTSWIATTVNQAGSYRIPRGSMIVGALQAQQQGLFWTDLALWAMQYVGPPTVYGFNEVGVGCGLIAPKAATVMSGVAYWMSQSQFFRYAGGGVEPILCPVWDVIFQDLDTANLNLIRVAPNSRFGEVAWFYPTTDVANPIKYVKYNIALNTWDFGVLNRTAWINQSVLGPPIGAADGYVYQHETSPDADGAPMLSSFQTGYFALDEADVKTFVDQVWPDMKWGYYGGNQGATVSITFYATDYAGQTPTQYGPFVVNQQTTYVTPRMRGRLVSISVSSSDLGSFWRLGNIRYRLQPDGRF